MRINLISFSFRKIHSRNISSLVNNFTVVGNHFHLYRVFLPLNFFLMQKIAPFPKTTISFIEVSPTFLRLVLWICCVVFLEFMRTMSKFALLLIGTIAKFHELSAELRFFFVVGIFWDVSRGRGTRGRNRAILDLGIHINIAELPFNSSAQHPLQTIYL